MRLTHAELGGLLEAEEERLHELGWDQPIQLFAIVDGRAVREVLDGTPIPRDGVDTWGVTELGAADSLEELAEADIPPMTQGLVGAFEGWTYAPELLDSEDFDADVLGPPSQRSDSVEQRLVVGRGVKLRPVQRGQNSAGVDTLERQDPEDTDSKPAEGPCLGDWHSLTA